MADFSYDDAYGVDEGSDGTSVTTYINWAGALVSLALLGGLGAWGWQLLVRDVSGVPVITALEGPMRVAPANPGGDVADHQGLAVNRIPAVGEAAPGADTVVLAPAPASLADEDAAMATLLPDTSEDPSAQAPSAIADQGMAAPNLSAVDLAVVSALAELEDDLLSDPSLMNFTGGAQVVNASLSGMAASPRPILRPRGAAVVQASAPAPAAPADQPAGADPAEAMEVTPVSTASAAVDISPDGVPVGTRLVQLGAFPTIDAAQAEWARVDTAFADYMGGKRRLIQEAETGGTSFYRLRVVGFEDLSDARRFCAVLVAGDTSCIPVVAR